MNRRPFLAFRHCRDPLDLRRAPVHHRHPVAGCSTTTGSRSSPASSPWRRCLAHVVAKALSGPLIDRIGPNGCTGCDTASVVVVGLVPLLTLFGWLDLSLLLPPSSSPWEFCGDLLTLPFQWSRPSPELADVPLERVTGVAGVIDRLASTVSCGCCPVG